MAASKKDIEIAIKRSLDKAVPESKVRQALNKVKTYVIEAWRKQLNDGIDEDGKRLPKLSSNYQKWKKKYVGGRIKHRAKSYSKAWYRDLYTTTDFRANSVPNHGRLTGQMFSAMVVKNEKMKVKNGNIGVSFQLLINNRKRALIAGYNDDKGRHWGFALGNSNRGKQHYKRILDIFNSTIFPKATFKSGRITAK